MTPSPAQTDSKLLAQARLFAEIARSVEQPLDAFPPGDAAEVAGVLWQGAALWSIAAAERAAGSTPGDDSAATARALLERAAGGPERFAAVLALVERRPGPPDLNASAASARAGTLRTFSGCLLDELEQPRRSARVQWARRAVPWLAGLVAVLAASALLAWLLRPPNLVPSAVRTLSSPYPCGSLNCGDATIHTNFQQNPWVRYDFGATRRLHSIKVENRTDCCAERTLPIIAESSNDGTTWTVLGRMAYPFATWSLELNGQARYVRLSLVATNYLHLRSVEIR